jgi:hypothetical protein
MRSFFSTLRLPAMCAVLVLSAASTLSAQSYAADAGEGEHHTRISDSSLTQPYTGSYGWSMMLPPESVASYNKILSKVNTEGQSEVVNFMLRGGLGGLTIKYYTERRQLPVGYKLLDSVIHFYEADSVGRNGKIYKRSYVLSEQAIDIEVMLTEKGQAELGEKLQAIFDSFQPPPTATFVLKEWQYGRNPEDYESGDTFRTK